jgi:BolA protein
MNQHTSIEQVIREKLGQFCPEFIEVVNESHMHNVPAGAESHFKVTLVSSQFEGKGLLTRHRMVNDSLIEELDGPVHALALHTLTPDEWIERAGKSEDSPPCLGGSKS